MKRIVYLLFLLPTIVFGQNQKQVSGQVVDMDFKEPVIGASVYITMDAVGSERSVVGAIADLDGNFTFRAPADANTLVVSFTGYESQTVDIAGMNSTGLLIEMKVSVEMLDEIVMTGYQETTMRKTTSSMAKVEAVEIKQAGVANIDQMLVGQLAGVYVQPTNGAPGSPAKINIRGTSTLNGSSDPLWVLDGIPLEGDDIPSDFTDKDNIDLLKSYPISGINPDDIESITVLKDASATSIYGARAANGVIVIKTKNGQKGKTRVNITANTFVTQKPDFSKLNLMNSSEKVDFELYMASRSDLRYQQGQGEVARILNESGEYNNFTNNGFSSLDPSVQAAINGLKDTDTNWGDEIYQAAINQQYGLSMSGGNDRNDYYFSAGYFDEKGATIGAEQKRFNLTLKNNYDLTDNFTVGVALFGSQNRTSSYLTGIDAYTNPAYYARTANPYLGLKDANGDYIYDPDLIERSDINLDYNLLEERANTSNELIANSMKSIFSIDYTSEIGIKITSQLGLQLDNDAAEQFSDQESYYTRKYEQKSRYLGDNSEDLYYMPEGGIIQNTNANAFQYNWKTMINYGQVFYNKHEVDVLVGTEFREDNNTMVRSRGFGYNPNTLTTVPITNERAATNSNFDTYTKSYSSNAYASFFGTLSYTYDGKYSLFSSLRYDGSNLFGVNPKYRYLPIWSVAGSWDLAKENFLYSSRLDILKLRASYGIQGNVDKTTSPYVVGTYGTESVLPGISEEIIRASGAPNGDLRWEKTTSSNIGFDLGIWDGRLFISNDYYYRKSTDLIGLQSVPLESGYNTISTNWATVTNKGFELSITTVNIDHTDFRWSTSFNISANRNNVDRVEIQEESFKPSLQGYSVNAIFAIKTDGLDSNGIPLFVKDGETMSAVDFYNLLEGTDGSQLTREEHRDLYTYVGDATPKFSGGINNTFRYKQFDLQIAANFNIKQTVKRNAPYHMTTVNPGNNYSTEVFSAGTGDLPGLIGFNSAGINTDLVYSWFNSGDGGNTYNDLDVWVEEISYLRINSIRLGYSLSPAAASKLRVSTVRFYLEGRNLLVFGSDYTNYFDPETYGSAYAQPLPKLVSAGLNLSF
ncbi:SusC/RagA family TonB-linked outer membrane protein [Reichenbachiella sp. MSK19-1]|uniref:SusC/RagA family TonB-linked outer membrane protein n=1 Tax=Reichenbachiella sp. MSK19-1 TaxID=1897631 RepID=UPI000E6BDFC5|nr:SusC/RagA family TonB-linked outer membrane protein [Reichenbachiella sp. MSK19-1]RJE70645.1 SusC/RagA family protein [Reichenbachiella sp. MSK19-1]